MKITKISILSLAKISAFVHGIIGIVVSFFFSVIFLGEQLFTEGASFLEAAVVSLSFIVFLPILYFIAGFIVGCVVAFSFNKAVSFFGGLEIETN
ncbi:MAG: hypothetical protein PHY73_05775 [Candidatus Omnitrophica bacterium]|nr:hypothetical protein [Candidatus Omnitrophota bacterium]